VAIEGNGVTEIGGRRLAGRIASPEMLPDAEVLPHLICSRLSLIGGANGWGERREVHVLIRHCVSGVSDDHMTPLDNIFDVLSVEPRFQRLDAFINWSRAGRSFSIRREGDKR
jgi:hypothetical protein